MAERVKLTNAGALTLKAQSVAAPTIYWDEDLAGFGVRVSPRGKAVFFVQYRDKQGKQEKLSLGVVGTMKADRAREEARTALSKVQLGGNPQAARRAGRRAETLIDVVTPYLLHAKGKLKARSYAEVERALMKAAKPLHHYKVDSITKAELAGLFAKVSRESGPYAANRLRANLSAMWSWALKQGLVDRDNPIAHTNRATNEAARDRVLSDAELRLIWRCTTSDHDYDRIVRLLMLTAARRNEVGAMAPSEVQAGSDSGKLWTLPANRSKNYLPHEVSLAPLAVDQLPAFRDNYPFVFGSGVEPKDGFVGWSKCKERLDKRMLASLTKDFIEANGRPPGDGEVVVTAWRLHDLRRTFSTWANENGVDPHIVEATLNHVSGSARRGVAGVYNRAAYRQQKAAALASWAQHILSICTPTDSSDAAPKAA